MCEIETHMSSATLCIKWVGIGRLRLAAEHCVTDLCLFYWGSVYGVSTDRSYIAIVRPSDQTASATAALARRQVSRTGSLFLLQFCATLFDILTLLCVVFVE